MFFLKNKVFIFLLIFLFLIIVSFVFLNLFDNFLVKNEIETKEECIIRLNGMGHKAIIEEVNKLNLSIEGILAEDYNAKSYLFRYFICQASNEKEFFDSKIASDLYYKTVRLFSLLNLSEEVKRNILSSEELGGMLYEWDENDEYKKGFINEESVNFGNIAFKTIEEICPNGVINDKMLGICLSQIGTESKDDLEAIKNYCHGLCDNLKLFHENRSFFEERLNNLDTINVEKFFYRMAAISFHIGGKDLALKFCDKISNSDIKGKCNHYAVSLDYINCKDFGYNQDRECEFKEFESCQYFYNKAKELICNSY